MPVYQREGGTLLKIPRQDDPWGGSPDPRRTPAIRPVNFHPSLSAEGGRGTDFVGWGGQSCPMPAFSRASTPRERSKAPETAQADRLKIKDLSLESRPGARWNLYLDIRSAHDGPPAAPRKGA